MFLFDAKFLETWAAGHMVPAGFGVVLDLHVTKNQLLPKSRVPDQVFETMTSLWQSQPIFHGQKAKDIVLELSWEHY